MKLFFAIVLGFIGILIFGQLFVWFLALGSGHNIPEDTQAAFLRNLVVLGIIFILFTIWRIRLNR